MTTTKTFLWTNEGTKVAVGGSFNGWELIPMVPVQGLPNMFEVIYNLPPGRHEYMFNIDGEWRPNDHEPCVRGKFGMVNTIFVAPLSGPTVGSSARRGHFLDMCCVCRKRLPRDKDDFMYGDFDTFCSVECREKQIEMDGSLED